MSPAPLDDQLLAGIALVTFLYVDFCDCTGTLFSMANYLDTYLPGKTLPLPLPHSTYLRDC